MSGTPDLKKIRRESFVHFEQDGLNEIGYGILALLMTPILLLCYKSTRYSILLVIFTILVIVFFKKIFYAIRKSLQVPRTGYGKMPMRLKTRLLGGLYNCLVLLSVYLFGMKLGFENPMRELLPVWFGLTMGGAFAYFYYSTRKGLYLLYCAAAVFLGIFSTVAGNDIIQRASYIMASTGIFFLASGIIRLRLFLRNHPRTASELTDGSRQDSPEDHCHE